MIPLFFCERIEVSFVDTILAEGRGLPFLAFLGMKKPSAYAFFNILCTGVRTCPNFGFSRLLQDPSIDLYLSSLLQIGSAGHLSLSYVFIRIWNEFSLLEPRAVSKDPRQDPDVIKIVLGVFSKILKKTIDMAEKNDTS